MCKIVGESLTNQGLRKANFLIVPTTKDLAEAAGVSLATVDRVLNDRPNVSQKTRDKVQAAIEQIGFVRNLAAVNLLRNKPYKFRFILPKRGDLYLKELIQQVEHANKSLRSDMTFADVEQLDMGDPHLVANYITSIDPSDLDGLAIMAPESPPVRDAISRLNERGVHIVQFLSAQENLEQLDFVGVNNYAAGATAAKIVGKFSGSKSGSIMVISETMLSSDSIERRHGFDAVINARFENLRPLPSLETYGEVSRAKRIIGNQLEHCDDIVGVYIMSSEARIPIEVMCEKLNLSDITVVVHERTPFSETALKNDQIDAIIAQNPGHAVRSALRILRARSEAREPNSAQESIRIEILLDENL